MIVDTQGKYLFDPSKDIFNPTDLNEFLENYTNNNLTKYIRNEYPDEIQETMSHEKNNTGKDALDVKHLNASQLIHMLSEDEYKDHNIFVLYYTLWDTRCAALIKPLELIAKYFKQEKFSSHKIIIAKINVESNDVHEDISEYPTMILYKNDRDNKMENGIIYYGNRTPKDIKSFIETELNINIDDDSSTTNVEVDVNGNIKPNNDDFNFDAFGEFEEEFQYV